MQIQNIHPYGKPKKEAGAAGGESRFSLVSYRKNEAVKGNFRPFFAPMARMDI